MLISFQQSTNELTLFNQLFEHTTPVFEHCRYVAGKGLYYYFNLRNKKASCKICITNNAIYLFDFRQNTKANKEQNLIIRDDTFIQSIQFGYATLKTIKELYDYLKRTYFDFHQVDAVFNTIIFNHPLLDQLNDYFENQFNQLNQPSHYCFYYTIDKGGDLKFFSEFDSFGLTLTQNGRIILFHNNGDANTNIIDLTLFDLNIDLTDDTFISIATVEQVGLDLTISYDEFFKSFKTYFPK